MKQLTLILFLILGFVSLGQFNAVEREDQLKELLDTLRNAKTDEAKIAANQAFDRLLESTLNEPTIFDIKFSKLPSVGVIDSPDGLVRIVNWNVELADQVQQYNGYVITRTAVSKEPRAIKLNYVRDIYNPRPTEVTDEQNWYGALYYQIVPYTSGSKDSYILLGWNGAGMNSNMKLIDVMSFTSDGVKFGQSIFKTKEATLKRVFFEHSAQAVMSLRYEEEYNRIIFDHLSPESPTMKGFYEYYVPDMSYDAFILGGNKLVLKEDVIAISKVSETVQRGTKMDEKSGEIVMETVDNEWVNPTSENAVSEQEIHIPVLPEGTDPEEIAKAEKKNQEAEDKKNMTALDIYNKKKHHKDEEGTNGILQNPKKKRKK